MFRCPPTDVGSHNPSPSGLNILANTPPHVHPFGAQSHNPSPLEPSVLASTSPHVHPLWGSTSLLAHLPMSNSDTICNNPNPPVVDSILFGLFLPEFPQSFKTHMLGRGFHTLIKNTSFSSPPNVRSHKVCVAEDVEYC